MRALVKALPLASAFACSTLVGADFDDLEVAPAASGGNGAAQGGSGKGGKSGGDAGSTADDGGNGGVSGSNSGGGSPAAGGAAAGQSSGGAPAEGGASGSGGAAGELGVGGVGGAPGAPHPVVLNEVKGQGNDIVDEDYIELFNTSTDPQDISGYRVADDGNAYAFPADTIIPGEGYIVVMLDPALTTGGPHTCFGLNNGCFYVSEWGISAGGEPVFFRDPGNQTLSFTVYPDELGPDGIENGQSWGRLPNGEGGFQATAITPGEPNTQP